jgi:hypothetical protein
MLTEAQVKSRLGRYQIEPSPTRICRRSDGAIGWVASYDVYDLRNPATRDTLVRNYRVGRRLYPTAAAAEAVALRDAWLLLREPGDPMSA